MSKIIISIPNKLYIELKQVALEQNVFVDNFVESAVEMYLEQLVGCNFKNQ